MTRKLVFIYIYRWYNSLISCLHKDRFSSKHYSQVHKGSNWWAQPNHLYRPQSWSRTNNTFRLVIPAMVVGSRRAMSPSSVLGPLQNIYPFSCRWKDNSPSVHRRSVTKKEWISPTMSQRIKRGAPTQIYVDIDRSPREKKVRTHTRYSNIY